jgi:hypothetical protein
MEKLVLIWISDQQAKGDNVNSTLKGRRLRGILTIRWLTKKIAMLNFPQLRTGSINLK